MYDLTLSWRNLQARPVQALIPLVVMALAIALTITVLALSEGARRGIVQASDPFGVLVIGPKGDGQQLVLNTILLQGLPLGTIPYSIYEELSADQRARLVVPLAKGDNVGGAPVIGTNLDFFQLRTEVNAPQAFALREGDYFREDYQAVLGSRAANQLGLTISDTFRAAHGLGRTLDSDLHQNVYTVVGILQASGTPYDNAVYTTVNTVWQVHKTPENDALSPFVIGEAGASDRLTSILVQPIGFVEQNQLWQEYYTRTDAQAVFPGQELGALFDLLRQGEQILTIVGYLVFGIATLTVFLSIYGATVSREREIAIMRSLGGSRSNVFRMVIFETLLLTVLGSLLGRVLGYGLAWTIATIFSERSAIPIPIMYLTNLEPLLWLLPIGVGVLAGLLPAAMAYRVDVVEKLTG